VRGAGVVRMVGASAALGSRLPDRLRLAWFYVRCALSVVLRVPRPSPTTAVVRGLERRVVIGDGGELAVLRHVVAERAYVPDARDPSVIVDAGANAGFATLYFKHRYPDARVIAVEADPRTYARLVENVEGVPGVETYHAAVAGSSGTMSFFCSTDSSICSSLTRRSDTDEEVTVNAMTLETLLEAAGVERVDLLKLDVEGAEADVLPTAPLDRIDEIIAELHYDDPRVTAASIRGLLEPQFDVEIDDDPGAPFGVMHARRVTQHR